VKHFTRSPAVSEKADHTALSRIAIQHADDGYSSNPDVEISAVRLFSVHFNVIARWHQRLWFKRWDVLGDKEYRGGVGGESCKILLLGTLPINLFRHLCRRMCRLVTMHSRDGRTDRQTTLSRQ